MIQNLCVLLCVWVCWFGLVFERYKKAKIISYMYYDPKFLHIWPPLLPCARYWTKITRTLNGEVVFVSISEQQVDYPTVWQNITFQTVLPFFSNCPQVFRISWKTFKNSICFEDEGSQKYFSWLIGQRPRIQEPKFSVFPQIPKNCSQRVYALSAMLVFFYSVAPFLLPRSGVFVHYICLCVSLYIFFGEEFFFQTKWLLYFIRCILPFQQIASDILFITTIPPSW